MLFLNLKRISGRINYFLSIRYGKVFPFYYACEYPRSGGTWVAHMISDYLQISFPKNSIFPLGHSCVVHNHWKYNSNFDRPTYVVRDGRDIAVSMMHYALKNSKKNNQSFKYYKKRFPSLFLNVQDTLSGKELFKHFISDWLLNSAGTKYTWSEHVQQWAFNKNVVLVKYEDFNKNCFDTLEYVLKSIGVDKIDEELLHFTVKKFSFEKQTGRKPGMVNEQDNKRKGIIGDWKNHFDKKTAELFHQHTGDLLLKLNYEKNADWYEKFE